MIGPDGQRRGLTRLARVPRRNAHTFARIRQAAALLTLVVGSSACGSSAGDVTIPEANADQMVALLERVEASCDQARSDAVAAARAFTEQVDQLPADVGADAKESLRAAGHNLEQLAASECGRSEPRTTTTDETTSSEPTTSSTESSTTSSTSSTEPTSTSTESSTSASTSTSTSTETSTTTETTTTDNGSGGIGGGG